MLQMVNSDFGMCGQIRVNWPAQALQSNGISVLNTRQVLLGLPTDKIFIQRCGEKQIFESLKKFDCEKILDYDDLLFKCYGEGLPKYNHVSSEYNLDEITNNIREGLNDVDVVTVSTNYLKSAFEDTFNFNKVVVVPNYLPRWIFHYDRKEEITDNIVQPTVLYAGSTTHYSDKDTGDFNKALIDFIKNNIDKINMVFIGQVPWFFNDIADKCIVFPFVNVMQYAELLHTVNPDFIVAPLKENVFNKCKSNLKYLEGCAIGAVVIGSSFDDSPYNCIDERCKIQKTMTSKHIEKLFWSLCEKDTYNEILNSQYDYINQVGWLENNVTRYINLFSDKQVGI
jgi:hypothetical protein